MSLTKKLKELPKIVTSRLDVEIHMQHFQAVRSRLYQLKQDGYDVKYYHGILEQAISNYWAKKQEDLK